MRNAYVWLAVAVMAAAIAPARAQQSEASHREKVEVTGSNIKRAQVEGPAPVTLISRGDLERSGGQNLQEVLTTLPYAANSFNEQAGFGNTFTPGTAGISLRGLGTPGTLVLLNGRRVANYAFALARAFSFVDLNSIPVAAIERIEILRDGASALYGSDAIAGVVNIILRKDFRGAEIQGTYASSSRGDADEKRASLTIGGGDAGRERFNVMATLDFYRRDPLFGKDRPYTATADFRSVGLPDVRSPLGYPGTWLTAGRGSFATNTVFPDCPAASRDNALNPPGTCAYDFQPEVMTLARTERKALFARGTWTFAPRASAFAEVSWNENDSYRQLASNPDQFTLPVGHNSNPFSFSVPILYRFTDVGPRSDRIEARSERHLVGLKGTFRDWDWEAAYLRAISEPASNGRNFISIPARNRLVSDNRYNFVDRSGNDPAILEGLQANPWRQGRSALELGDVKTAGTIAQTPWGPLGLAVGAEYRRESVRDHPDPLSAQGLIAGSGSTAVVGNRNASAEFAEFAIPLPWNVEVQAAVRRDRYSDFGNSIVPKVAVSYRPKPSVLLRAGYNKGFRAPSLAELFAAQTESTLSPVDSPRCSAYRRAFGTTDPRAVSACLATPVRAVIGGNPQLQAEKSEAATIGFAWDPVANLSVVVDAYSVRHAKRILVPSLQLIFDNEAAFPGAVIRAQPGADDRAAGAPGPIVSNEVGLFVLFYNAQAVETRGVEVELRYRYRLQRFGRFDFASTNSYMDRLLVSFVAGMPSQQFAGAFAFPRYRGTHSMAWQHGDWSASIIANVAGPHRSSLMQLGGPFVGPPRHVRTYTTTDAQLEYSGFRDWRLTAGVRNIFHPTPPFPLLADSLWTPVGRLYYGRVAYRFR